MNTLPEFLQRPIITPRVEALLRDYKMFPLLKKEDGETIFVRENSFEIQKKEILRFGHELLGKHLTIKIVQEIIEGLKSNKNKTGLETLYNYVKVEQLIMLNSCFDNGFNAVEIGLKHAERKDIIQILESELFSKLEEIGSFEYGSSTYTVFQDGDSGTLLSTYTKAMDQWVMTDQESGKVIGSVISNSSYSCIICPNFNLGYLLWKSLNKKLYGAEIEFPFNRLGAMSIRNLFKEGDSYVKFKLSLKVEPKIKSLL